MRTISLEMIGWNIRVPADSDFAGRNRENNATRIEIATQVEGCAYSIDMMAGLVVRSDVMAVDDGMLSYTIPESMTKSGNISFQIVGVFEDGTKTKSNVIKCKIGPSINAIERVEPEEATIFEQALAAYSDKLSQAIASAGSARESAAAAAESESVATSSAAAAFNAKDGAAYYAGIAAKNANETRTHSDAARTYSSAAKNYSEKAEEYKENAASSEVNARKSAGISSAQAAAAKKSADEAKDAAKQAQSSEAINNAIKWHNLDALAHPEIRALIPDLKGFVKYTTQDLVWYYKKTETYTKSEVNALIEAVPKFSRRVVDELPLTHISDTTIYLIRSKDPQAGNLFTEYIYVDGAWEIIGGQSIEISGYVKTEDLNAAIIALEMAISETYATKEEIIDAYTKTESDNRYAGKTIEQDVTDVKGDISQLSRDKADADNVYSKEEADGKFLTEHQDVSQFITKAVSDLANYYTKSDTYTKAEINNLVSAIPKFKILPVDALPTSDISDSTIYLLKTSETETGNLYTEYIRVGDKWEELGTQTLDLSGYALKSEVPNVPSWALADNPPSNVKVVTFTAVSGMNVFDATYDEVVKWINDGFAVVARYNNALYLYSGKYWNMVEFSRFSSNSDASSGMGRYGIEYIYIAKINGMNLAASGSNTFVTTLTNNADSIPTSKAVYDALMNKIDNPSDAPSVGKVLKVKSVNEDNTFACEWADDEKADAFVVEYQVTTFAQIKEAYEAGKQLVVNYNNSIYTLSSYSAAQQTVTFINIGTRSIKTIIFSAGYWVTQSTEIVVGSLVKDNIMAYKTRGDFIPTTKAVYDFLTDNTTPLTDEEKAKIRTRLGL